MKKEDKELLGIGVGFALLAALVYAGKKHKNPYGFMF
jgi:hypothetical protein